MKILILTDEGGLTNVVNCLHSKFLIIISISKKDGKSLIKHMSNKQIVDKLSANHFFCEVLVSSER